MQRVYALALGHEDLNDHEELRHDPALRTAVFRMETLKSDTIFSSAISLILRTSDKHGSTKHPTNFFTRNEARRAEIN